MASHIGRRKVLATLGGAAVAWPLGARAQQAGRVRRIGVLNPFVENDAEARANLTAFRQTLEKLGWSDGRNVRIDYRWGSADPARIRAHAKELVSLDPNNGLPSGGPGRFNGNFGGPIGKGSFVVSELTADGAMRPLVDVGPRHNPCYDR
jgi:hypothetical protein